MIGRAVHKFADPAFQTKLHFGLAVMWVILVVPTLLLWASSVLWVALMSLWANIAAHAAAALASHADAASREDS